MCIRDRPDPDQALDGKVEVDINGFNDSELYVFFGSVTNAIMQRFQATSFLPATFRYFDLIKKINKNGRRDLIYAHIRKAAKGGLLNEGLRASRQSSDADRQFMKKEINELFADKALEKYINIFEND